MVTVTNLNDRYTHQVETRTHVIVADEPADVGGDDRGMTPYELLLASLGACTAITVRMYAGRKNWPLKGVRVDLELSRIHAKDCLDCDQDKGVIDVIEKRLGLDGPLSDEQRKRLSEIAERCPVNRTLAAGAKVRLKLVERVSE